MGEFLTGLTVLSLTLGGVAALLLALGPALRRAFRPQWRCWAWLLIALRLAVPLHLPLPGAPLTLRVPPLAGEQAHARQADEAGTDRSSDAPLPAAGAENRAQTARNAAAGAPPPPQAPAQPAPVRPVSPAVLLFALWAAGAGACLAVELGGYALFLRRVRRWQRPDGTRDGVPVFVCPAVDAPVLAGLRRPRILLPEGLEGEARRFALAHELTHLKRRDLWYKLLLVWCGALHWFNPLVWLLRRAAQRDIEIACDQQALQGSGAEERRRYGAALLSCAAGRWRAAALTSQFAGGRRSVKARLRALVAAPPRRRGRPALALVAAAALLAGSVAACGPDSQGQGALQTQDVPQREAQDALPDGVYYGWPSSWDSLLEAEELPDRLPLELLDVDPETLMMQPVSDDPPSGLFPLAEDPILLDSKGGLWTGTWKEFFMFQLYLSYSPYFLRMEVADGAITSLQWLGGTMAPARADRHLAAVVHIVDPEAGTVTYAVDDGAVGADSDWQTAPLSEEAVIRLGAGLAWDVKTPEELQRILAPKSSWGLPCRLDFQGDAVCAVTQRQVQSCILADVHHLPDGAPAYDPERRTLHYRPGVPTDDGSPAWLGVSALPTRTIAEDVALSPQPPAAEDPIAAFLALGTADQYLELTLDSMNTITAMTWSASG